MRITINDREVIIPTSLSEISLGQRIDFYIQHGKQLDEMLKSIYEIQDLDMRELELSQFVIEKMFRTFSFFTGTTPEALKESEFVDDIARIYFSALSVIFDDEDKIEPQSTFNWKGEQWILHPPELKQGSKMTFGEFIDSKQVIQDMIEMGNGSIERLLPLCAIYLRKEGEEYREEFLYEGSERLELMKELPMDIAMQVGFFLSSSMNLYMNTLQSSGLPEPKAEESSVQNISKGGDGSTSSKRSLNQKFLMFQLYNLTPFSVLGWPAASMF